MIASIGDSDAGYRVAVAILAALLVVGGVLAYSAHRFVARDISQAKATLETAVRLRRELSESGEQSLLTCRGVDVAYDSVQVLFGVDVDIREGEIVALLGTNGAGKSTLLKAISGVVDPIGGAMEVRDHVAAAMGLPASRGQEDDVAWSVHDLVELMNLGAFRDEFVGELSPGSRRIVDLAMAIAHDPVVLILDEPSSGIAQRETEALAPLLRRIRDEAGCAMLIIEHDMPLITEISDRMLALELGTVIAEGTPRQVIEDARVVSSYLGGDIAVVNRSGAVAAAPRRRREPLRA